MESLAARNKDDDALVAPALRLSIRPFGWSAASLPVFE